MCFIEWTINLPVMFEYLNMFIIHEFLLRVYLVVSQKIQKYKFHKNVYTITMCVVFVIVLISISTVYCTSSYNYNDKLRYVSLALCVIVILINPIIIILVLRSLKHTVNKPGMGRAMFIKILIIGCLFEVTMILRIFLVYYQD